MWASDSTWNDRPAFNCSLPPRCSSKVFHTPIPVPTTWSLQLNLILTTMYRWAPSSQSHRVCPPNDVLAWLLSPRRRNSQANGWSSAPQHCHVSGNTSWGITVWPSFCNPITHLKDNLRCLAWLSFTPAGRPVKRCHYFHHWLGTLPLPPCPSRLSCSWWCLQSPVWWYHNGLLSHDQNRWWFPALG